MNKVKDILFAACASLALASVLSCSSDAPSYSYSYCILLESKICHEGSFTAGNCEGQLSNSCPFNSPNVDCPDAATEKGSITYGDQTYETVKIGTQVWMKNNLNYAISGSKCGDTEDYLSDDNTEACNIYGRLYDWATAMDIDLIYNSSSYTALAKHQGICPPGWHIPSNAEWDQLYRFADGTTDNSSLYQSFSAGKHLKAQIGWNSNGNGLNTHCFSALPGGYGIGTSFKDYGLYGNWWSSSESDNNNAYLRFMFYESDYAYLNNEFDKSYLFSVRCIQN